MGVYRVQISYPKVAKLSPEIQSQTLSPSYELHTLGRKWKQSPHLLSLSWASLLPTIRQNSVLPRPPFLQSFCHMLLSLFLLQGWS